MSFQEFLLDFVKTHHSVEVRERDGVMILIAKDQDGAFVEVIEVNENF